jgi:4-hydroxy-4-methyl-2-oxoglutarate aldolase
MTDQELRQRFSALDTATISDALDRLGIVGQCAGLAPRVEGAEINGPAFTVRYVPVGQPAGTVGDYIDDVAPGEVVVLDNSGRVSGTVWGDILTEVAHIRGVNGTVIDGLHRDIALCRTLRYPVFSAGVWMRTGKDRVQADDVGGSVSLGGVRVAPGDWVRGDADGVICIAASRLGDVLDAAESIQHSEARIREAVRSGASLREARRAEGYHDLQRRAT